MRYALILWLVFIARFANATEFRGFLTELPDQIGIALQFNTSFGFLAEYGSGNSTVVVDLEGTTAAWTELEIRADEMNIAMSGVFSPGLGQQPIPIDLAMIYTSVFTNTDAPFETIQSNPDGTLTIPSKTINGNLQSDISWTLSSPNETLQGSFTDEQGWYLGIRSDIDGANYPNSSELLGFRAGNCCMLLQQPTFIDVEIAGVPIAVTLVGYDTTVRGDVTVTAIPEPGTGLLAMTGLLGLACYSRGRVLRD